MRKNIYRLWEPDEFSKAGPSDLIELLPVPGQHPLFFMKVDIERFGYAVIEKEYCHISGPTGTAKTAMIEAFYLVKGNWQALCTALGSPVKPLKLYPIETLIYETPGELFQRRALRDGTTYDEKSALVNAIEDAVRSVDNHYPLIWTRELGRVHSTSVQGGLLDMITKGDIALSDGSGSTVGGSLGLQTAITRLKLMPPTHWLPSTTPSSAGIPSTSPWTTSQPNKRSWCCGEILKRNKPRGFKKSDDELIEKVVQLGHAIRRQREEGNCTRRHRPLSAAIWLSCAWRSDFDT